MDKDLDISITMEETLNELITYIGYDSDIIIFHFDCIESNDSKINEYINYLLISYEDIIFYLSKEDYDSCKQIKDCTEMIRMNLSDYFTWNILYNIEEEIANEKGLEVIRIDNYASNTSE